MAKSWTSDDVNAGELYAKKLQLFFQGRFPQHFQDAVNPDIRDKLDTAQNTEKLVLIHLLSDDERVLDDKLTKNQSDAHKEAALKVLTAAYKAIGKSTDDFADLALSYYNKADELALNALAKKSIPSI